MTNTVLAQRDRAEIRRSAEEAKNVVLWPSQVERYLNPPRNTAYPLEYAFHLLGDARGKNVLDLGCGTGENIVPLAKRGARVIGMDISPHLVSLAQQRLKTAGIEATLRVGSAYETGLPDKSVDLIFCVALIHHLDIVELRNEIHRILGVNGVVILSEPIRFSPTYSRLRNLLPAREDISEFEHPLTESELATFTESFRQEGIRFFRLPFLPLLARAIPASVFDKQEPQLWKLDHRILNRFPAVERYATNVTMRLRKVN
jgi:SAM-dependent methyltransferase